MIWQIYSRNIKRNVGEMSILFVIGKFWDWHGTLRSKNNEAWNWKLLESGIKNIISMIVIYGKRIMRMSQWQGEEEDET